MGEVMTGKRMDRRAAVARLLDGRKDLLVVTGLGSASYDVMAAGDHPNNYYLWAAMGSATTVGLGLAMTQKDKSVLVLTGDGELMMGLGALATVSVTGPKNLTIAVIDNGLFGETGQQLSHAGKGIEISKVAAGLDFAWTGIVEDEAGLDDLKARLAQRDGPRLATVKVTGENPPRVLPPRDGVYIKNRFRAALGFDPI